MFFFVFSSFSIFTSQVETQLNTWSEQDSSGKRWWNSSYPYRYKININGHDIVMPYAIRLSNGRIIWALIGNDSYVYSTEPNMGGNIAIGTETSENYWEYEDTGLGNSPEDVYSGIMGYNGTVYHMNQTDKLIDRSGIGVDVVKSGTPELVTGIFGNAVYFSGDDFYKVDGIIGCTTDNCKGSNTFPQVLTEFSVDFWMNLTTTVASPPFGFRTTHGAFRIYANQPSGKLRFDMAGADGDIWADIETNTWYHVGWDWNGTHAKAYLNGIKVDTVARNWIYTADDRGWVVGAEAHEWYKRFKGTIDAFHMSNKSLPEEYYENRWKNGIGELIIFGEEEVYDAFYGMQWWFWTIIILGITTSVLALTTIHYLKKARTLKEPKVILRKPVPKKEYKLCPNCGARLPVDSKFCGKCGSPLK